MVHITRGPFDDTPVLLPPLAEQKRIVAAIEEQFSRLDFGVAALERARQNLRRMRAAVLQEATEDALADCGRAPMPLSELLLVPLANGRSVPDGPEDGYPVLRLTAVRGGQIDLLSTALVSKGSQHGECTPE
jgi:type I restriction enzyme S subunit